MQLQVVYFLILSIGIHSVSRCGVQAQEGAPQLGPDVVSINVDHSPLSNLDKVAASVNESRQEEVQTTTDNDEKNSQDTPDTRLILSINFYTVTATMLQ